MVISNIIGGLGNQMRPLSPATGCRSEVGREGDMDPHGPTASQTKRSRLSRFAASWMPKPGMTKFIVFAGRINSAELI